MKMYIPIKKLERVKQLEIDEYATTVGSGPLQPNGLITLGALWSNPSFSTELKLSAHVNLTYYCRLSGNRINGN